MDVDRKLVEEIMYLLEEIQTEPDNLPGGGPPYEQRLHSIMANLRRVLYTPSATVCGHRGCKLKPGHFPGHTDR
jgi:hypothetical protein